VFVRATIFQFLVFCAWFFTAIVVTSLLSMANGSKKFGEYFVLVAAKGRAVFIRGKKSAFLQRRAGILKVLIFQEVTLHRHCSKISLNSCR
jgi:hypothetical protein